MADDITEKFLQYSHQSVYDGFQKYSVPYRPVSVMAKDRRHGIINKSSAVNDKQTNAWNCRACARKKKTIHYHVRTMRARTQRTRRQ